MTDITKCPGRGCPARERCYRYTAPAGEWQAWSDFDARRAADAERCGAFLRWPRRREEAGAKFS